MYLSRTMCDVLEEMRSAHKTLNFSYLLGLIEEVQSMGNRMEAALSRYKDAGYNDQYYEKKKFELRSLEREIDTLEHKKEILSLAITELEESKEETDVKLNS